MIPAADLSGTAVVISSYLYALSLLFVAAWILSYALSTFTVGNTLTYLILRKNKDGENLLQRKDREEEEEEDDKEDEETSEKSEPGEES